MRARVGYVPDSSGAYQSLSAAENLQIRCAEWGLDESREVPRVLSLVGLDIEEKKSVSSFSLGMKRRLDIATALLGDTDLLILMSRQMGWTRWASRAYGPLSAD